MRVIGVLVVWLLLAPASAWAAESGVLAMLPADSVTHHSLAAGAETIEYTATAGTLRLNDGDGAELAALAYVAFIRAGSDQHRPITFGFNGGPGAGSAYLTLGLVGPRRLEITGHDGSTARLVDNPQSWLRFTDLVMIDPVGTGWSRAAHADKAHSFYGVRTDADTMAKAIALYTAHAGRAAAQKFLLGESYGGLRAVKVAAALQRQQGIVVAGMLMVSPLLDTSLTMAGDQDPLAAALRLPSLAAGAKQRSESFDAASQSEVETFALGDYLTGLVGPPPQGDAAAQFFARIARLTGVDPAIVARTRGFLGRAAQSDGSDVLSSYDDALAAPNPYPETAGGHGGDVVLDGFTRAFGGAFVAYARDELGFRTDITYQLLDASINRAWDWHSESGMLHLPQVQDDLRELLALDPSLRVFVANGYGDLVTPYMGSLYILGHLPPIGAPGRVVLKVYPGGHMIYLREDSRLALTADAEAFITKNE